MKKKKPGLFVHQVLRDLNNTLAQSPFQDGVHDNHHWAKIFMTKQKFSSHFLVHSRSHYVIDGR